MAEGTGGRTPRQGSRPQQAHRSQAARSGSHGASASHPHRRVGGDTGTIPVIDSTGSLPRGGVPRVDKTVVMSRDEIRRVAELEEGSRVHAGSTAEMPAIRGGQRRRIPDSDRPVVVETTGRRRERQAGARRSARPAGGSRMSSASSGRARDAQDMRAEVGQRYGESRPASQAMPAQHARTQQRQPRHASGQRGAGQRPPRQGHPREAQPTSARRQAQRAQAPQARGRAARPVRRRRRSRLPVVGIVVAAAILVLVAVSVARCNAARVAAEQAAQEQTQQEQEAQQQQQQKATEIAGLPEGTYYIEPADETAGLLALDVSGVGDDAYTTVIATTMEQSTGQQIRLVISDDGSTCTLSNGELYLDVGDVTAGAGRSVFANKASGGDSQSWKMQQNSDGTYSIISAAADYAIAVDNPYDGTQVTCEEYDSTSTAQRFNIVSQRRAEELEQGESTSTTSEESLTDETDVTDETETDTTSADAADSATIGSTSTSGSSDVS